jgi:hypothetical protein
VVFGWGGGPGRVIKPDSVMQIDLSIISSLRKLLRPSRRQPSSSSSDAATLHSPTTVTQCIPEKTGELK